MRLLFVFPPFVPNTDTHLGVPQLLGYLAASGYTQARGLDLNQIYLHNVTAAEPIVNTAETAYYKRIAPGDAIRALKTSGELGLHFNPLNTISIRTAIARASNPQADKHVYRRIRAVIEPVLRLRLEQLEPEIVGFSVVYPEQVYYALIACQIVKEWRPSTRTMFGGPQVYKHRALFASSTSLHAMLDLLVSGDGEVPIAQILAALERGGPIPDGIPNLMKATASGYSIPEGRFELKPSEYATPNYDDFPLQDLLSFRMTKGCVWGKCTFCTYPVLSETYFGPEVERTLAMLSRLLERYRPKQFLIVDDAVPAKTLRELSRALIERDFKIEWGVYVNFFPPLQDPELAQLMKRSGCRTVKMGLESYNDRILSLMQKMQRQANIIPILETLKGAGLQIILFILIGFPTETREEAEETLNFLLERGDLYDRCFLHHFNLEEETPIFRQPQLFGIRNVSNDKNAGFRAGYAYDTESGMSRDDSARFVTAGNKRLMAKGKLL